MKCGNPVLVFLNGDGGRYFRHFDLTKKDKLPNVWQVFKCGKCLHCRKKRAYELACRCVLHASLYEENAFVTLTYDEKKDGYHNNFQYKDIQDFKKRLRSHCLRKHGKRTEIFNVHEYGKNGKKHWHLIVFNHSFPDKIKNPGSQYYNSKTLLQLWPHGHHSIGDVTEASAMYQANYMKKDFQYGYVTSKQKSHSIHRGIGGPYFLKHYKQILTLGYVPISGKKMPLPRYFEKLAEKLAVKGDAQMHKLVSAYKAQKLIKIEELEKEWDQVISQHLTTNRDPDFLISLKNTAHDLRTKNKQGDF